MQRSADSTGRSKQPSSSGKLSTKIAALQGRIVQKLALEQRMILKLGAAHLVPRSCFLQFVGILAEVIGVIFRREK